jgi:hypothetical protein
MLLGNIAVYASGVVDKKKQLKDAAGDKKKDESGSEEKNLLRSLDK